MDPQPQKDSWGVVVGIISFVLGGVFWALFIQHSYPLFFLVCLLGLGLVYFGNNLVFIAEGYFGRYQGKTYPPGWHFIPNFGFSGGRMRTFSAGQSHDSFKLSIPGRFVVSFTAGTTIRREFADVFPGQDEYKNLMEIAFRNALLKSPAADMESVERELHLGPMALTHIGLEVCAVRVTDFQLTPALPSEPDITALMDAAAQSMEKLEHLERELPVKYAALGPDFHETMKDLIHHHRERLKKKAADASSNPSS